MILDVIQDAGWRWRHYLSEDLRIRVIEAVEAGSSRRGAAARFGVSVSSAIRPCVAPDGPHRALSERRDRRSGRIAPSSCWPAAELQALERARPSVGTGTVWRFFDRHGISFEKKPRTPPSRSFGWPGSKPTRSRSPPTGFAKMARLRGRSKRGQRCRAAPTWTLEDNYLHRRSTPGWRPRRSPGRADRLASRSFPPCRVIASVHKVASKSRRRARHVCPAALFARLQSHRTSEKGRRSNPSDAIAEHRTLHTNRFFVPE